MTRTFTISSGKGGVGKTNLCVNLAIQMAALGHRICVFDADLGLANINIVLGLYPEYTIEDVILGKMTLPDILIKDYHGIDIIPGSSGVEQIANIQPKQTETLIKSFEDLDPYDFIFFDTSAGISRNVVSFCLASTEIITLITPEPTSLTDAYALIKVLTLNGLSSPVRVVVNQCEDTTIAKQTYTRFKEVVKKYLSIDVQALGFILKDPNISAAVKQQQPFISLYPATIATKCVRVVANNLSGSAAEAPAPAGAESFWKRFVGYFKGRLDLGRGIEDEPAPAAPPASASEPAEEPPAEEKPIASAQNNDDASALPLENTQTEPETEPVVEITAVPGDAQEPAPHSAAPESIPPVEMESPDETLPVTEAASADASAGLETLEPEAIPAPQPVAVDPPVYEMSSEDPGETQHAVTSLEGDLEALSRNTAAEFEPEPVAEMPPAPAVESSPDKPHSASESTSVSAREAREVASPAPLPDEESLTEEPQPEMPLPVSKTPAVSPALSDPQPAGKRPEPPPQVNETPVHDIGTEPVSSLPDVALPDAPVAGPGTSPGQAPSASSLEMTAPVRPPETGNGSGAKTSPAIPTAVMADQHLYSLVDRLVSGISSISDEVKQLRTAVEGNGHLKADRGSSGPESQPIALDFNSFLSKRSKEK